MTRDAKSIAALKKYSRIDPDYESPDVMEDLGANTSDRAIAIICVAYLEDTIERAIRINLRSDLTSSEDSLLFQGDAPLSTFSSKVRMAYAMGICGPKTRDLLVPVQAIRNAFAHSRRPLRFNTPEVAAVVKRLAETDFVLTDAIFKPMPEDASPRDIFKRAVFVLDVRFEATVVSSEGNSERVARLKE